MHALLSGLPCDAQAWIAAFSSFAGRKAIFLPASTLIGWPVA
jgi:hypothetical protein